MLIIMIRETCSYHKNTVTIPNSVNEFCEPIFHLAAIHFSGFFLKAPCQKDNETMTTNLRNEKRLFERYLSERILIVRILSYLTAEKFIQSLEKS